MLKGNNGNPMVVFVVDFLFVCFSFVLCSKILDIVKIVSNLLVHIREENRMSSFTEAFEGSSDRWSGQLFPFASGQMTFPKVLSMQRIVCWAGLCAAAGG